MVELKQEIMKIFDFILENNLVSENGIFTINHLKLYRKIINEKTDSEFILTEEQKNLLIKTFISNNVGFSSLTPEIILSDEQCIFDALDNNIYNVDFLRDVPEDLLIKIIELVLKNNYIVSKNTPKFLKNNISVLVRSIELETNSIDDFEDSECLKTDDIERVIETAIKKGYVLTENSPAFLLKNKKIILASLQKDLGTVKFVDSEMIREHDIFKYLLLNGYNFSENHLFRTRINHLKDKEIMESFFDKLEITSGNEVVKKRILELYHDAINTKPSIKNLKEVFSISAEHQWKKLKNSNHDLSNIFGKICGQLKLEKNFDEALSKLTFLEKMEEILDEKYNFLLEAMQEYFNIYHSTNNDKMKLIQSSQNEIAKLSALYIAKLKETFKKQKIIEYTKLIKPYFILKRNHPYVVKRTTLNAKKDLLYMMYLNKDEKTMCIHRKYSQLISDEEVEEMFKSFLNSRDNNLSDFRYMPLKFNDYIIYLKVSKIINRLNSGYISFSGKEVEKYKHLIDYDTHKNQYFYIGPKFFEVETNSFQKFIAHEKIYSKLKKDLMEELNKLEIEEKIENYLYEEISSELPFIDEYFEFNSNKYLNDLIFRQFYRYCISSNYNDESFINKKSYEIIYNLLVNKSLIWYMLFYGLFNHMDTREFEEAFLSPETIFELMNSMSLIVEFSNKFHLDLNELKNIIDIRKTLEVADETKTAILGMDIIEKLCNNMDYVENTKEEVIKMACDLVSQMVTRNTSTIPYINGKTLNYKYSMYDSLDISYLISGINTNSCYKLGGSDNDFMHYCALNKNGFTIKICDKSNNFIAKASGFRNGNVIYINQLRSIYDLGGNNSAGNYEKECEDIIETLKKACEDIILTSGENKEEKTKIDKIFINKSYLLKNYEPTVSMAVTKKIGDNPMDTVSQNWIEFKETLNLKETLENNSFDTDFGLYEIISFDGHKNWPSQIKHCDVPALYFRKRNQIIITNEINMDLYAKLNRIEAISDYQNNTDFKNIEILENTTIFCGDNWFILCANSLVYQSKVLMDDEVALKEYNVCLKVINSHINENSKNNEIESLIRKKLNDN